MPDQVIAFALLIATLREGRDSLCEAQKVLDEQDFDMATVHRLLETTRDLADLAQSLVLLIEEDGSDEPLLIDANDLAAFFWTTEESLEARIGLGRG